MLRGLIPCGTDLQSRFLERWWPCATQRRPSDKFKKYFQLRADALKSIAQQGLVIA